MHFQGTCVLASKTSASSTGPPLSYLLNDIKYQWSSHSIKSTTWPRCFSVTGGIVARSYSSEFLLLRRLQLCQKTSHLLLECRRWRSSLLYGLWRYKPFNDHADIDRFNLVRNNIFLVISLAYRWARLVPNPFLTSLIRSLRGLPPGRSLKRWTLWGRTYHESHQTWLLERRIHQNIMSMTPNLDSSGWHSGLPAALNQSGWTFLIWNPSYSARHGYRHITEISLPPIFVSGDRWPCSKLLQHLSKVYQADLMRGRGMGYHETANANILTMGTHQKYFDTTPWPFHRPQLNLSDSSGTVRIILWLTQWATPVNRVSRRFWCLLTNSVTIMASSVTRRFLLIWPYWVRAADHIPSRIGQSSHRFISGQRSLEASSPGTMSDKHLL